MIRLALLGLLTLAAAHDVAILSNQNELSQASPPLSQVLTSGTAQAKVLVLDTKDFDLGVFTKAIASNTADTKAGFLGAFSKSAKYSVVRNTDDKATVTVPPLGASDSVPEDATIVRISAPSWNALSERAEQFKALFDNSSYVVILPESGIVGETATSPASTSSTEEAEAATTDSARLRVKRVAIEGLEGASSRKVGEQGDLTGDSLDFPVVLPPWNKNDTKLGLPTETDAACLLYLEGVDIIVYNKNSKYQTVKYAAIPVRSGNLTNKWIWNKDFVQCPVTNGTNGNFSFTVAIDLKNKAIANASDKTPLASVSGQIAFTLKLEGRSRWWRLTDVTLVAPISVNNDNTDFLPQAVTVSPSTPNITTKYVGLEAVEGYAWNCGTSQAVFFNASSDGNILVGIALYNTQIGLNSIRVNGKKTEKFQDYIRFFGNQVVDCTGTFSPGSWMGIISTLVLVGVFIFGFLMLNSVQTGDRFDDPKQKQLIINARE